MQRTLVHQVIRELPPEVPDPVPPPVRAAEQLPDRRQALIDAHFPPPGSDVGVLNSFGAPAQQRLIFEEFFLFQAGLVLRKRRRAADRKARPVVVDDRIRESARRVEALIDRERARGVADSSIVLAGFSQGGGMALHTGLRHRERLAGIMALSCFLPLAETLAVEASAANRLENFAW